MLYMMIHMLLQNKLESTFFRSKSKGSNNGDASPEKNGDGDENAYGDD